MKVLKLFAVIVLLSSSESKALHGDSRVICRDGKAYVEAVTWYTGCRYPASPYFRTLSLAGHSPMQGKISIEMDYESRGGRPGCDNPRGMPHFFKLGLPVDKGVWEIEILGQGTRVLNFQPSCSVR